MSEPTGQDDYDTPWKEAITRYFPDFIAFYFPAVSAQIDWEQGYEFLDQELAQIAQDAELGKRLLDKLAKVRTYASGEQWVYAHTEVQGQQDQQLAERVFSYNYRIYDKYRRPVASLVVLADTGRHWRPDHFGYELFGCRVGIDFPVVKLLDYQGQLENLLADPNPFALVTAAHLLTQQTKGDNQGRFAAKWRLAKLLYRRDWDKQRIIDLFSVLDWMMQIPPELQQQLWRDIEQLERNQHMPYITSVERIGMERGLQQGLQQGRLEGKLEGKLEGEAAILERQLNKRFGPLSDEMRQRLTQASQEQLESWADRILDASSLTSVFDGH
jgi:hypothetical protein